MNPREARLQKVKQIPERVDILVSIAPADPAVPRPVPRNPMHCAGPFPPFTFSGKDHVPITTRMTRFHAEKPRNGADGQAGIPTQ